MIDPPQEAFQLPPLRPAPPQPEPPKVPEKMKPEVKHLVTRFDRQTGLKTTDAAAVDHTDSGDKWASSAICVTTVFNFRNEPSRRILEFKAPVLKDLLKRAIGDGYPGVSFKTERVLLNYPLRSLFHNLAEIEAEMDKLRSKGDEEEAGFLDTLSGFLEKELKEDIVNTKSLLPQGRISYELLWAIFKPGSIYYTTIHGNPQALRVTKAYEICGQEPQFVIESSYINYNGTVLGKSLTNCSILPFEGTCKISELNCIPMGYHPEEDELKEMLIARGKRFEELIGRHYLDYKGLAVGPIMDQRRVFYSISGRVMIDCESYSRLNTDRFINVIPFDVVAPCDPTQFPFQQPDAYEDGSMGFILPMDNPIDLGHPFAPKRQVVESKKRISGKVLGEEDYLICSGTVSGFAFGEKKWAQFSILNLSPIVWNDQAWKQLVLPTEQKGLMSALIECHAPTSSTTNDPTNNAQFDDFIEGKGKGLIFVLHGSPGTGKTLTSESIAEHTRRPLYAITSGELGTNPAALEQTLSRILDVAAVWNAILLIDEADVFLEKRSLANDLNRNGLVSIFLRLLEYYEGIMILTTNRVTTFDPAFQSRIHLALKYEDLSYDARLEVWRNFLTRIPQGGLELDLEKDVEKLAERKLNGRVIKNVVKTAGCLARSAGSGLGVRHLEMVLKIQGEFEKDFAGQSIIADSNIL